jgi:hypothetical protein
MSRIHTFEKRQCDRCQHRSAVKNTPPPSLSFPVPILPPHRTHHPSANWPGPMILGFFGSCDLFGQWRGSLAHSIRNPFRSPPPPRPVPAKPALPVEKKGLSLSEGLGKEYMTWHETSVGKTGTQAEGRHVVIRASQG